MTDRMLPAPHTRKAVELPARARVPIFEKTQPGRSHEGKPLRNGAPGTNGASLAQSDAGAQPSEVKPWIGPTDRPVDASSPYS